MFVVLDGVITINFYCYYYYTHIKERKNMIKITVEEEKGWDYIQKTELRKEKGKDEINSIVG